MKRSFLSIVLISALILPSAAMAQRGRGRCGQCPRAQNGVQASTNGNGNGAQLRQRRRDGTGVNCPYRTSATGATAQTTTQPQTQKQNQGGNQKK